MIGYLGNEDKEIVSVNIGNCVENRFFCRIGCCDKDEIICTWNENLLKCQCCGNKLTFIMQIVKNVVETNLIFYVFLCTNFESKCAQTTKGWKVFRDSINFSGYMKFTKHLPIANVFFKTSSGKGKKTLSGKEKFLLDRYNQRDECKNGDMDEWAADEGDQGWVGESYERDKYKEFIKLQDEIANDPKQVIRCTERPLLLYKLPKLPNCPNCKSQIRFMFQLLPTLGYHLSKRFKLKEYEIDILCNNLLVFSCSKFCTNETGQPVDEFVILQVEF